jgi:hypothetical protein
MSKKQDSFLTSQSKIVNILQDSSEFNYEIRWKEQEALDRGRL